MANFERLDTEHRAAWNELISIENSKEGLSAKIKRIIKLFDTELLVHFKDEEDNVLTDDAVSLELIDEHQRVYKLIDSMKAGTAGDEQVREFISILRSHIKKEDKYFGQLKRRGAGKSSFGPLAIVSLLVIGLITAFYFLSPNKSAGA